MLFYYVVTRINQIVNRDRVHAISNRYVGHNLWVQPDMMNIILKYSEMVFTELVYFL